MHVANILAILSIALYITGWGYTFGYLNYFGIDSSLMDISFQKIILSNIYVFEHIRASLSSLIQILTAAGIFLAFAAMYFLAEWRPQGTGSRAAHFALSLCATAALILGILSLTNWTSTIGNSEAALLHDWLRGREDAPPPKRRPETVDVFQKRGDDGAQPQLFYGKHSPTFYVLGQNGASIFLVGVLDLAESRVVSVVMVPYDVVHHVQIDAIRKRGGK
jgi:hypothetical protein